MQILTSTVSLGLWDLIRFQDKTNIGTCIKKNKNQSCLLVITYLLHLDFMVRLKFIPQTCTELFSLWGT